MTLQAWRLQLRGRVQGIGMRPALYRLARRHHLQGRIRNQGGAVVLELHGEPRHWHAFLRELPHALPPQAQLEALHHEPLPQAPPPGLAIEDSRDGERHTQIPPDLAPCPQCLAELHDPEDRRHRYPFLNCTQCGPRLSIFRDLPYDRPHTALAGFPLCPRCAAEYHDPEDRRYHAQAIACPHCGPQLRYLDRHGRARPGDPLRHAVRALRHGALIALAGVGGYQLACLAHHERAIARLRRLKDRPHKPLALLAPDLATIARHCHLQGPEIDALQSPAAPIVLLQRRPDSPLPDRIAPGLPWLGFMLPASPLHHLLAHDLGAPLVLTSGNRRGHPPCRSIQQALQQLAPHCDGYLVHDRPIEQRLDDPVYHLHTGQLRPIRLGRGSAPQHLPLPPGLRPPPDLLALGGQERSAFCLLHGDRLILSQHLGDLDDQATEAEYRHALERYLRLLCHRPRAIASDAHPDYTSTRLAQTLANGWGIPHHPIQHHHAHLAACLGEHRHPADAPPVLGIAADGLGLGLGEEGQAWGGEIFLFDYRHARHLAQLRPAPLPGGDRAARQPWRNAWARLRQAYPHLHPVDDLPRLAPCLRGRPLAHLEQALQSGLNSPPSSALGRLFDAVAALLDLSPDTLDHDAQAAMALEAAARPDPAWRPHPFALHRPPAGPWQLDPAPALRALLAERHAGHPRALIAWRFHHGLAQALARLCHRLAQRHATRHVALAGGVFQNRLLSELLTQALQRRGLIPLLPRHTPCNDGALALGQALILAARLSESGQTAAHGPQSTPHPA